MCIEKERGVTLFALSEAVISVEIEHIVNRPSQLVERAIPETAQVQLSSINRIAEVWLVAVGSTKLSRADGKSREVADADHSRTTP